MLFTFDKAEIVSEALSLYHINLDSIAFLQEVPPNTEFSLAMVCQSERRRVVRYRSCFHKAQTCDGVTAAKLA